jgi:hypothetical protein
VTLDCNGVAAGVGCGLAWVLVAHCILHDLTSICNSVISAWGCGGGMGSKGQAAGTLLVRFSGSYGTWIIWRFCMSVHQQTER